MNSFIRLDLTDVFTNLRRDVRSDSTQKKPQAGDSAELLRGQVKLLAKQQ